VTTGALMKDSIWAWEDGRIEISSVSTLAAKAGVFVSEPQKRPAIPGTESFMSFHMATEITPAARRTPRANKLTFKPRFLKEEKKTGPTAADGIDKEHQSDDVDIIRKIQAGIEGAQGDADKEDRGDSEIESKNSDAAQEIADAMTANRRKIGFRPEKRRSAHSESRIFNRLAELE